MKEAQILKARKELQQELGVVALRAEITRLQNENEGLVRKLDTIEERYKNNDLVCSPLFPLCTAVLGRCLSTLLVARQNYPGSEYEDRSAGWKSRRASREHSWPIFECGPATRKYPVPSQQSACSR